MNANDNLRNLFRHLDMDSTNGLVENESEALTGYQRHFYETVKGRLGINAVYFMRVNGEAAKIPVIYFRLIESYDTNIIAELHQMAWNLGEAPLLFVVTPEELLIFNNYVIPQYSNNVLDPEAALIEKLSFANEIEFERQIQFYKRINIESGEYWRRNNTRFQINNRVDSVLLKNLRYMRNELMKSIKNVAVVHCILGRTILIKYLEDRKDKNGTAAFPEGFYGQYYKGAKDFTDVLQDKRATYRLFNYFNEKFHGDMFPITEYEENHIQDSDIALLREFITGKIDLENSQYRLWSLYQFDLIPIQLISTIYEMLFQMEVEDDPSKNRRGTYYTPYHLVEMLVDEVYPWDGEYNEDLRVLDPACGSGVFLVEIYRRIISRWISTGHTTHVTPDVLTSLLEKHIFGVDLNLEAIRIASFSLCLVLCDYLEPISIWNELTFPALSNSNLFQGDFFDNDKAFNSMSFDLIIGNPPWESSLTKKASNYLKSNDLPVGDQQISQAFTWKAADLIKSDGWICLLMPSKGFLFNISSTNLEYRYQFFKTHRVATVINYSGYRTQLFQNAKSPATAIFYQKEKKNRHNDYVLYCTPKPTYTLEDRRQFIIEPLDIVKIPLDLLRNKHVWKICMYGGPRDLELVNKLIYKHKTLGDISREKFIIAEGYKRGNRKANYPEMVNKRTIDVKADMCPFTIDETSLAKNFDPEFERVAKNNMEIFQNPHLVIKQSPVNGRLVSAVLDYDAIFSHSILGIHSDLRILKFLCILLSSSVFSYYAFMTSGRWIIERSELEADEIKKFPVPEFTDCVENEIDAKFEQICNSETPYEIIDSYVYELYGLYDYERTIIKDTLKYVLGYTVSSERKKTIAACKKSDIETYKNTLISILGNTLNRSNQIHAQAFLGKLPLLVLKLTFQNNQMQEDVVSANEELNEVLCRLDKLLVTEYSQGLYVRRNMTIYEGRTIYLIKPNQARYWTYATACRDADDIYAQIMRCWRERQ